MIISQITNIKLYIWWQFYWKVSITSFILIFIFPIEIYEKNTSDFWRKIQTFICIWIVVWAVGNYLSSNPSTWLRSYFENKI